MTQGLYSLSGKTSYRKISWSLEAARFGFKLFQSLWNLAGTSAALLPRCLSNFRAIRPLQHPISRLRDFTRFVGKTSYRLVNRGPGVSGYWNIFQTVIDKLPNTFIDLLAVVQPVGILIQWPCLCGTLFVMLTALSPTCWRCIYWLNWQMCSWLMHNWAISLRWIHTEMDKTWLLSNTLGPRQMDAISQTTFSSGFSWMKMFDLRLKFYWNLFVRV